MILRPALSQDIPFAADVAAQAMLDDELFAFLCPHRREFYSDYRNGFLRRLQMKYVSPGWSVMVAVEDEKVVGYGVWERIGDASRWREGEGYLGGWWNALERTLLSITHRYTSIVYPDRSVDNTRLAMYNANVADYFPFDAHPELWYLSSLAVYPSHQRKGIGRNLVEWGLQQASRDQVPVGLEASIRGTKLYEQLGFRTINEGQLVQGITIRAMIWDSYEEMLRNCGEAQCGDDES